MDAIGRIGGLWRYPVKSLGGEALQRARIDETGIIGDRRWALKNRRSGELVNCKVLTALLTIGAAYAEEPAPGYGVAHAVITLPDGRHLRTSDPSTNGAISAIAGQPLELWPLLTPSHTDHYRLRRPFTPEVTKQRMGLKPDDPYPDFSAYEPEMIQELQYFFSPRGSYKDAYPLHYVTSAALKTLASYHPGLDVDPRRFRPNFYIEGVDMEGFPELKWKGFDLIIGDVVLNCGEETVRCVMPSQAQRGLKAEPHMGFVLNKVTGLKFGAYCHIRRTGTISLGDEVFLERHPKSRPMRSTVLPLPAELASGNFPPPPALPAFYRARVVRKTRETADTVSLGLKMPADARFPFLPGQHLIFRLTPRNHPRPILRSYSLSQAPATNNNETEDYSITVKRIGLGSDYLQDAVEVGDQLEVRWPRGLFFALPESPAPIALISNGIGVTPLFSMLQTIARVSPQRTVFWLHATPNSSTQIFRQELAQLRTKLTDFHGHTIYRQPLQTDTRGVDYQSSERVTPAQLAFLTEHPETEVFICGAEAFTATVRAMATQCGIPEPRIHTEKFFSTLRPHNAGPADATHPAKTYTIHFKRSGVDAEWSAGDPSLLEIAEQAGVPADYGCRFGACLACSARLEKGEVHYADPEIVAKPGEALICCAQPASDLVLDL